MTVKNLKVKNYRNYDSLDVNFSDNINILYGHNAQGKTNILEALYIASAGKSHRTNSYFDLIKKGELSFEINLTTMLKDRENLIKIRYVKDKGKHIEINGVKRDKLSDILGHFNMIMFSPETLEVIKGTPLVRRKFLDILLCQTNRSYLYNLQQYNALIKNKSAALKKSKYEKKYIDIIPIWNEKISFFGGKIAASRMNAIRILDKYMKIEMSKITAGKETSSIKYKTFCDFNIDCDEKYFTDQLKEKLDNGIESELNIKQCLYGIHRDDFEIFLNQLNSRYYCSQGQQRTLALSLIIAELHFIEDIKGEKPVLLLDDVMSELDNTRQNYLIQGLYNVQTIITTTDPLAFDSIKNNDIKRFYVKKGKIYDKIETV
ncbi:MAG: DNA replication/repair protein RecF [Clostridiaceae bacterium]|nr:DNA replication/repair protein RecF [Clostridiaceae bacterium]